LHFANISISIKTVEERDFGLDSGIGEIASSAGEVTLGE